MRSIFLHIATSCNLTTYIQFYVGGQSLGDRTHRYCQPASPCGESAGSCNSTNFHTTWDDCQSPLTQNMHTQGRVGCEYIRACACASHSCGTHCNNIVRNCIDCISSCGDAPGCTCMQLIELINDTYVDIKHNDPAFT